MSGRRNMFWRASRRTLIGVAVLAGPAPQRRLQDDGGRRGLQSRRPFRLLDAGDGPASARQCGIPETERFVVGNASETADNQALTRDLANDLMTKFHSAFSRFRAWPRRLQRRRRAERPRPERISQQSQRRRPEGANVGRADVVIRALAANGRRSLRVTLRATHVRKEGCDLQMGPFEVPERFLAEAFLTPDMVFQRVAKRMWNETRDRKFYLYRDSARSTSAIRRSRTISPTSPLVGHADAGRKRRAARQDASSGERPRASRGTKRGSWRPR